MVYLLAKLHLLGWGEGVAGSTISICMLRSGRWLASVYRLSALVVMQEYEEATEINKDYGSTPQTVF